MSFVNSETWAWFKTAPLPVVLSICLTSFTVLGTWSYAIEQKQAADSTKVAVAAEKAEQAAKAAEKAEQKLDKANEKLDKLLEIVAEVKAEQKSKKGSK
jgi:hypothetical protein